ncbi:MAG: mechanosensitive ion channel family protein [Cyanobacteria bacterium J06626_14]
MDQLVQKLQDTLFDLISNAVFFIPGLLTALVVLALTRYAANFVRRLTSSLASRLLTNRSLQTLLVQISFIATWITGVLLTAVIAFPDLGLSDIIALLGLGSVAVGFAFQDIFKNFLAGIILLLQQPFRIGDQIIVDGYEGTVEEIALRSTQIRTYAGEEIVIPNSIVFTSTVQVLTAQNKRRTDLAVGVDYNTPLSMAVETLTHAVRAVDGVADHPPVEVDVVSFGDSSIDLMVRYWSVPQQPEFRRIKTKVMIAVKATCDRASINIPYPIRTVYWFDQEKFSDYQQQSLSEH